MVAFIRIEETLIYYNKVYALGSFFTRSILGCVLVFSEIFLAGTQSLEPSDEKYLKKVLAVS